MVKCFRFKSRLPDPLKTPPDFGQQEDVTLCKVGLVSTELYSENPFILLLARNRRTGNMIRVVEKNKLQSFRRFDWYGHHILAALPNDRQ